MWTRIIQEIIDAGWTERAIAKEAGVEQPTINRLKKGIRKSTSYETGEKLKKLHDRVMAKQKRMKRAS